MPKKIASVMFFILTKWWLSKWLRPSIFFAVLCIESAPAQVMQTERYEINLADAEQGFELAPAENKGVFIFRQVTGIGNSVLELNFVDTTLQSRWHGYLPFDQNYIITGHRFFDSSLFFILHYVDFSKNDLKIIRVNYAHGTYMQYAIKNFIPFSPNEFYITNKAALIGGYFNKTPVVVYYDFATRKSKILPGLFNEPGELTQIKTYPNGSFDVLVSARNIARKKTIWIKNYDSDGEVLRNIMLEPEGNKHLIFGRCVKTPDNMQIVAGTYSNSITEYSKGIFVARVDLNGDQQVRYYNYGDLENFFKYMRAKREIRIKNRIERRKIKGRKIRFNYRLLVHELVPYQGQFILLGEAFYPKYIYNDRYTSIFAAGITSPRGPIIQNGKIFDGYYYTHAVVIGLDATGKFIWDNSFEINDVRTFKLDQFVKLDANDEKINLLYVFNNEIRSKIIKDNNVVEGKSLIPIKLKSNKDFMNSSEGGDTNKLQYWYDHYFIAYGTQWLRSNGVNPMRKVFFMNKVMPR